MGVAPDPERPPVSVVAVVILTGAFAAAFLYMPALVRLAFKVMGGA